MCDEDRPEWWKENERVKRGMRIPTYEPPRFVDGTYTHEVVDPLEERFDTSIRFVGFNTTYPDDWVVQAGGRGLIEIERRRDENGNTVYQLTSSEFERQIVTELRSITDHE